MAAKLKTPDGHTANPDDVLEAETKRLNLSQQKTVSGIAISGGGIRSASFGLGVMQALVANKQMDKIDYMSTVSGGGYLGAALTWALKQGGKDAGTTPDKFPLGKRGMQRDKDIDPKNNSIDENDNKLLDFIRLHGSYLAPTSKLGMLSFIGVVLRSIITSLTVYVGLLTTTLTIAIWCLYQVNHLLVDFSSSFYKLEEKNSKVMLWVGIGMLAFIVLMGFIYSVTTFKNSQKANNERYIRFIRGQGIIGSLLQVSLVCFVLGSLPVVKEYLNWPLEYLAGTSTSFGTLVGLWQYRKAQKKERNLGIRSDLLIYAGAIALFYGILLTAYLLTTGYFLETDNTLKNTPWFFGVVLVTLILGFLTNLNLIGPHHMWRNRLMEAFMPNKEAVKNNSWMAATEADTAMMHEMCDVNEHPRPYHIINTNVILSNSSKVDYSGRGGDNFIISPLFCGCDATGWRSTEKFQINGTRSGISLATAMATSAAALNPNAAVSGEGFTRNAVVSILLSMLNLRLGYWTSNPSMENTIGSPNFFHPGLTNELLRGGLNEKSRNLQLCDGGHYENLGLYELIRRKLDLIIVSDGGADPTFNFDDLANAVEKVRVDFGGKISFIDDYKIECMLPGTAGDSQFQKKYDLAKHGFAIADIHYANNEKKGMLIYLKLAMIENMSTDVFSYKGINPDFPHQSTTDQFFNEKQFEAYRELGYYITWQMMETNKWKDMFGNNWN